MEDWMVNRLASEIVDNVKRAKKIRQCVNRHDKTDLAIRYAVACAKDAKVKATHEDIWKIAFAVVRAIDRM